MQHWEFNRRRDCFKSTKVMSEALNAPGLAEVHRGAWREAEEGNPS